MIGDEIPVAALASFYERMYPRRSNFLKGNWRWFYRTGRVASGPAPIVAMEEGRVVGHLGVIPVTLRRGSEERQGAWGCDIAVLPECRGKAVAPLMLNTLMSLYPLRIGFPNEMSRKVTRKMGWGHEFHTQGLSLLLRPERHPKVSKLTGAQWGIGTLASAAGLVTRVISRARAWKRRPLSSLPLTAEGLEAFTEGSPAGLHIPRSAEYLRWRLLDHPSVEEHLIFRPTERTSGGCSAVARVVENGGYRRLHLLTLRAGATTPSGRAELSNLFAGVIRWALDVDIHVISLVTSDRSVADVASWWLPISKQLCYAYHADDPEGMAFLGGSDHHWEYLDNDFDLNHVSGDFWARELAKAA